MSVLEVDVKGTWLCSKTVALEMMKRKSGKIVNIASTAGIAALLDAGADRSAKLHAYGGDFDVLEMFKTSAHPHHAGVAPQVREALAIN